MATKKNFPRRIFASTDAELSQISDSLVQCAERDITNFAEYGISQTNIDNIKALVNSFNEIETDEEMLALITQFTNSKNETRGKLEIAARSITTRIVNKFGENSTIYKQIHIPVLTKKSDAELCRNVRRMLRVLTPKLPDLADIMITEETLANLKTLNTQLDDVIDDKEMAEKNREIKTGERIDKGNELYSEIVKIANTGKDIWYSVDEAKYNDYIIINSISVPEEEPETEEVEETV